MSIVSDKKTLEDENQVGINTLEHVEVENISNDAVAYSTAAKEPREQAPIKWFVYVVAAVAAMGGLLFGYDIGGSGGTFVMQGFRDTFGWPDAVDGTEAAWVDDQKGWITGIFSLGALAGALPSGTFADMIGRKTMLMINCVIFVIGTGLQTGSVNIEMMYAGRFFGGFAIGSLSCIVTMYQSEMAPESIRGVLVTLQQLCITFGIVVAASLNIAFETFDWGWRLSYGGNIILAIAMFIIMFFLDESPRWLVQKGKIDDARNCLKRIRQEYEVEDEIAEIREAIEQENIIGQGSWREVFSTKNNMLYRLMVGCGGQFFQQLCGINAIMFFAPSIISTFFGAQESIYGNLGIQVGNFLATFICIVLIEKVGRVSLLVSGGIGMFFGTILVCILSSPALDYKNDMTTGVFIIIFCAIYVIFFAYSWGPVIWVLCAEIYPQRLRGKAMSLSTATNWTMAFVVGKITPILLRPENLDMWGTFLFFAAFCFVLTFWAASCIPETANVPLEKMDELFHNFKVGFKYQKPQNRDRNSEYA